MVRRILPLSFLASLIAVALAVVLATSSGSRSAARHSPVVAFHTEVFHNTAAIAPPPSLSASLQHQLHLITPKLGRPRVPSVEIPNPVLHAGTCEISSGSCSLTPCVDPVSAAPAVVSGGVYQVNGALAAPSSKTTCRHPAPIRISTISP